jgi:hypothetical protein
MIRLSVIQPKVQMKDSVVYFRGDSYGVASALTEGCLLAWCARRYSKEAAAYLVATGMCKE